MKKKLLALSYLISISGFSGAGAALLPRGAASMGITTELLRFAPFSTFMIPGIFLLVVFGIGNLVITTLVMMKKDSFLYALLLLGIILLLWLVIQSVMIRLLTVQHIVSFFAGGLQIYWALNVIKTAKIPFPFQAYQH